MSETYEQEVERVVTDLPAVYSEEALRLAEALKGKLGAPSGNKIRITQSKKFRLPTGEESGGPIDCVVIDFISKNEFYSKGFSKDDMGPPDCFAISDNPSVMVPSKNSPDKQAETCSSCPNAQWGTGPNGKGKACKNQRLLAVMPVNGIEEDSGLWTLGVSPTAIKGFDNYISGLLAKRIAPISVITEVSFDPSKDYPALVFKAAAPLTESAIGEFMSQSARAAEMLKTEPDVSQYKKEEAKPVPTRGRR